MHDGSKNGDSSKNQPQGRMARFGQRLREWQIKQHVARGMAYGVGSGAVSLLLLWVQARY